MCEDTDTTREINTACPLPRTPKTHRRAALPGLRHNGAMVSSEGEGASEGRERERRTLKVAIRCDASAVMGTGHMIRCLALADELTARGHLVAIFGEITDLPWVSDQVQVRRLPVFSAPQSPDALAQLLSGQGYDAAVLDGYHLAPETGVRLQASGVTVLAISDDEFGADQAGDLYLDQNLGAVARPRTSPGEQLLGLDYALFRDELLRHRPDAAPERSATTAQMSAPSPTQPLRVLAVFGGSDPYRAASVVVPLLMSVPRPLNVTAIAANDVVAAELSAIELLPGQRLEVSGPRPDLMAIAADCDFAVTASGSSVWEFLCLGVPIGAVCVIDNQRVGYDAVAGAGAALPCGHLEDLRQHASARATARGTLRSLADEPATRAELSRHGRTMVDGLGRSRVADALERAVARRPEVG